MTSRQLRYLCCCLLAGLLCVLPVAGCARVPIPEFEYASYEGPVRNAVLMIGDGMGSSELTLGRLVLLGADENLAIDTFPFAGMMRVHSASSVVTDSAAAATAMNCGVKTSNKLVGLDEDGQPVEGLLRRAHEVGLATGIATTTRVTHATPAAFYAHVEHRHREEEIAEAFAREPWLEVLMGGGSRLLTEPICERIKQAGFEVVRDRETLLEAEAPRLLGLFADSHMQYEIDRIREAESGTGRQPSLAEMTSVALDRLSRDPDGFFLVVEGGRIDQALHAHDAAAMSHDLLAFDTAVEVVLAYAQRDGHTLVVVTADHATAGTAITELVDLDALAAVRSSVEAMARRIAGGEELEAVLREEAGLEELSEVELAAIAASAETPQARYDFPNQLGHVISQRYGVTFMPVAVHRRCRDTHGHVGEMAPVYAYGPYAYRFSGTLDNTELPGRISEALNLEERQAR